MSYFKNLEQSVETAAPLPANKYKWFTYNGTRAVNIANATGKRTVKLSEGSTFGLRESSKGNSYRLISKEYGPTIVFTLSDSTVSRLLKQSTLKKAAPGTKAKSNAKASKEDNFTVYAAQDKNFADLQSVAKKVFADLVANDDVVKALKTFNKLAESSKVLTDAAKDKAAGIKFSKREVAKQTKDAKLQKAATQAIALAKRFLKSSFADAADMVNLAVALKTANKSKLSKLYYDTAVREQMPDHLFKTYMNARSTGDWVEGRK